VSHDRSRQGPIRQFVKAIKRFFQRRPERPADPYAYVTAPKRPGPPHRSAAAVAELPDD
jgi:hypothetical protein